MVDVFAPIGDLAASQHGLITLSQVRKIGVSRRTLDRLIAQGQLVRLGPGVFLVHGTPDSWQRRIQAERLAAGPDAIVSHRSAAALYELDGFDALRTVHLTVPPYRQKRPRTNIALHRSLDYDLIRPTTRQGIVVTDVARLVLDLYAGEPNREVARRGLFSVRKKKLATWGELHECLESHARRGRRGIVAFRDDLELYSRIGCPETGFEDAIRTLLVEAGLPEPELQHEVTANGHRYRIDVAYPELRIGIEGKSKAHHLTDEAFESDAVRDADLAVAGWLIIHATWAHVHRDPAGVVRRARQAINRRAGAAA